MSPVRELAPEELRRPIDAASLSVESTEHLPPLTGIVGQPRAVSALEFGLDMKGAGFNVYAAGPPGLGKMTAVRAFLEDRAARRPTPSDWCYVANFADPYQPRALELPAGRGRVLQQDIKELLRYIEREIPRAFDSEDYGNRRDEIVRALNTERDAVLARLSEQAAKAGLALQLTPLGVVIVPMLGGRPLSDEEFQALPPAARDEIGRRRQELEAELKAAMKQVRQLERTAHERVQELDRLVVRHVIGGRLEDLVEKYSDCPGVVEYLHALEQDLLDHIDVLKAQLASGERGPGVAPELPVPAAAEPLGRRYQVNLLIDNSARQGAPVVVELNPSYANLVGRIEKETRFGVLYTDFTLIKPGALHRARGGYLVIPVEELLRNPGSWDALKRALASGVIEIEDLGERLGLVAAKSLRPQPIPLDVKVVLVGRALWYYVLYALDEEFAELFKVRADFDTRVDRTEERVEEFLRFVCTLCQKEGLPPVDASGAARILEHAVRLAEDQDKLSTEFGAMADLVREASHWATLGGHRRVSAEHVEKALREKVYRSSLLKERIQDLIARGTLLVETSGTAVGQVNGLSVVSLGDYAFGRPSRITATVGPGREGIVDIEREVKLGGPLHTKGVLILSGYLTRRYAQDKPLTLAARLVFEQSYEGVDGDSASSAELYALLSALSGVPLRQGIAVTGSVDQHGRVQAIGGVNEKIEGFFEVCRAKGLTGDQGVLIPASNRRHLMLRPEVVEAVGRGEFHIWAVDTIDEGLEVLTGLPAGERDLQGQFPPGTMNRRVDERLREFAERLRQVAAGEGSPTPRSDE